METFADNNQRCPSNAFEITLVDESPTYPTDLSAHDDDKARPRINKTSSHIQSTRKKQAFKPGGISNSWIILTAEPHLNVQHTQCSNPSATESSLRNEIQKLQNINTYLRMRESRLQAQIEEMEPLFKVGWNARTRKLAKEKSMPDPEQVQIGNHSTHYADPVVDASLYFLKTYGSPREDTDLFSDLYRVTWETVREMRDYPPFIEMISWYGTLNSWAWDDYGQFEDTYFYEVWHATVEIWYEGGLENDLE